MKQRCDALACVRSGPALIDRSLGDVCSHAPLSHDAQTAAAGWRLLQATSRDFLTL